MKALEMRLRRGTTGTSSALHWGHVFPLIGLRVAVVPAHQLAGDGVETVDIA